MALVERTTRTVRLTDAGEHFYAVVAPALGEIRAAEEAVHEEGQKPRGTLRLHVSRSAESFLNGPFIAGFLDAYPEVRLDLFRARTRADRAGEVERRPLVDNPKTPCRIHLRSIGSPAG